MTVATAVLRLTRNSWCGAELYGEIDRVLDTDSAYDMAITLILPEQNAKAVNLGYQVVDCASVVATHVNKIARNYLPELFNDDEITHLHHPLSQQVPKLAEDLIANLYIFSEPLFGYHS